MSINVREYTFHPIANLFPMMQQEQYQALLRDIAENGQLEPVWTLGNQILDGRNRWSACLELGLEPITREYEGSTDTVSLVNFTISLNLNRRHLTKSQLATLADRKSVV